MKLPEIIADKKTGAEFQPLGCIYMRVVTESQLEDQSLKKQIDRIGFIRGTMVYIPVF
ncbi:hypothetical protein SDC9_49524 [bioreactor metagenome]|uniref:Uncharacterized protein n=1 Tax=bioreactor metagenome TaxID=1076179 RepID=A0A644WI40_9ZZZZ